MSTLPVVVDNHRCPEYVLPATGFSVVLTLPPGPGRTELGLNEVAMALHLSRAAVTRQMPPTRAAALLRAACQELGLDQVRRLARDTRRATGVWLDGGPAPRIWSHTRARACTDAAFGLTCAAANGELTAAGLFGRGGGR